MSQNFTRLVQILDRYKWKYLLSVILLLVAILARTLEPKVLQIAVDQIVTQKGDSSEVAQKDIVAQVLMSVLPDAQTASLPVLLLSLGLAFMFISVVRGIFLFVAMALKTYCSEQAAKALMDKAFAKIQRLPLTYFSGISKGELIQRCTGDIDTIKKFVQNQVISVVQIFSIFTLAFTMMCLVDWRYALISVALTPILVISGFIFFQKEGKIWVKHEEEADKLNAMVQEKPEWYSCGECFCQ